MPFQSNYVKEWLLVTSRSKQGQRNLSRNRNDIECHYCNSKGHIVASCPHCNSAITHKLNDTCEEEDIIWMVDPSESSSGLGKELNPNMRDNEPHLNVMRCILFTPFKKWWLKVYIYLLYWMPSTELKHVK